MHDSRHLLFLSLKTLKARILLSAKTYSIIILKNLFMRSKTKMIPKKKKKKKIPNIYRINSIYIYIYTHTKISLVKTSDVMKYAIV